MPINSDSLAGEGPERFDAFGFNVARYDATMHFMNLHFRRRHRVSVDGH
jgi:hypothetical protein